jgi:hypothetical protein
VGLLALKYKRERIMALQLKRFMTSILGRIDQERTAAMKKLNAEVAQRPGYNELGDPRAVEIEREKPNGTHKPAKSHQSYSGRRRRVVARELVDIV